MSARVFVCLVMLATVCSTNAFGQVGRDVAERGSNRSQISKGKAALESGTEALLSFSGSLASLKEAVDRQDTPGANEEVARLQQLMGAELASGAERAEAMKRELAGSVSETGSNRRESRRNREDSDSFGRTDDDEADAVRDGVNRVDDARDVADDKKDLAALGGRLEREQQIAQSFASYQFDLDSPAGRDDAGLKVAALEEFEGLMQQELKSIEAEIAEDRKEAGEDRRETRDDVREADEPDNEYRRDHDDFDRHRRR